MAFRHPDPHVGRPGKLTILTKPGYELGLYRYLYTRTVQDHRPSKPVQFVGSAQDDIRDFPDDARDEIGYQIYLVQLGRTPPRAKPMSDVGNGCWEIRVHEDDSWFRAFYVASLGDAVYVLHAFEKKSNKTPKNEFETGKKRYKMALAMVKEEKQE
jgi:phage-related protein